MQNLCTLLEVGPADIVTQVGFPRSLVPPMADGRKRRIDDLEKRVDSLDELLNTTVQRVDTVEYRQEQQEKYRYFRVEHSTALTAVWAAVDNGELPKKDIRQKTEETLTEEVKTALGQQLDEQEHTRKAGELSRGNRAWPAPGARQTVAQQFNLAGRVEHCAKAGQGHKLKLVEGEETRKFSKQVRESINWILYVQKMLKAETNNDPPVQFFQNRGPLERRKHQAKGAGKDKGKGNGKGKAKGKKGRK